MFWVPAGLPPSTCGKDVGGAQTPGPGPTTCEFVSAYKAALSGTSASRPPLPPCGSSLPLCPGSGVLGPQGPAPTPTSSSVVAEYKEEPDAGEDPAPPSLSVLPPVLKSLTLFLDKLRKPLPLPILVGWSAKVCLFALPCCLVFCFNFLAVFDQLSEYKTKPMGKSQTPLLCGFCCQFTA